MIVAEGPQIDGEVLVIILVVFLLFAATVIGLIVAGCVWAGRAGRGSGRARTGWYCVIAFECALMLWGLVGLGAKDGGLYPAMVASVGLGIQTLLYTRARGRPGPGAHDR